MGGMKYVSAYMMSALSGKEPTASDIEKTLKEGGLECDKTLAEKLCSELAGKNITEVIEAGREQIKGFGGGVVVLQLQLQQQVVQLQQQQLKLKLLLKKKKKKW